jgi:UDP-glucose 4-epimerase
VSRSGIDEPWRGRRVLVTGGAGFIANGLIPELIAAGSEVTVFDNLSTAEPDWREALELAIGAGPAALLRVELGDIRDASHIEAACRGQDIVVHLASSTDIPGGADDPSLDFEGCVVGTSNVLQAMQRAGIRRLVHASSGVVYGSAVARPSSENAGPLLPESHYAAAKLATEALISGYAHLGGWRAVILRFGNVIGPRTNHGVVHDFVVKLLRDRTRLEVLGDGRQAKPFIAVGDLVAGIRVASAAPGDGPVGTYNVATHGAVPLSDVARIVAVALGLDPDAVSVEPSAERRGWPGDTTQVELDSQALCALGWSPALDGRQAVLMAATGIAARYRDKGLALLTGMERRRSGSFAAT